MHIGDKVRLLHDKQEGIVVKMIREDLAEVEIEEGFTIPVLTRELVKVSGMDRRIAQVPLAKEDQSKQNSANSILASKGIYLAMMAENEVWYEVILINNTDYSLAYTVHEKQANLISGVHAGFLESKSIQSLVKHWDMREKKASQHLLLKFLYFHRGLGSEKPLFETSISLTEVLKNAEESEVPLLVGKGKWIQLDKKEDKSAGSFSKYAKSTLITSSQLVASKDEPEIDLHIEKLVEHPQRLDAAEMLAIQISKFEQALQKGIENKRPFLIFIHGVGAGVLRTEIHKRLSLNKQIKYFEDAQKERFGFGATRVQIC